MIKNFDKAFNDFMFTRIESIGIEFILDNKEYKEASKTLDNLIKQIKDLLPTEHKNLIDEYDEVCTLQGTISEYIIYKEALKDGMQLERFKKEEGLLR